MKLFMDFVVFSNTPLLPFQNISVLRRMPTLLKQRDGGLKAPVLYQSGQNTRYTSYFLQSQLIRWAEVAANQGSSRLWPQTLRVGNVAVPKAPRGF